MKTRSACLMAVLCLITSPGWSQQQTKANLTSGPLKLSPLLEQADQYPSVQALYQVIQQATIDQQLTKEEGFPQLDFQAQNSYGTYNGMAGASFPLPGSYNVSGSNITGDHAMNLQVSGVAHWDLIQFGKLKNKQAAAGLKTRRAEKQLEIGIWQFKYQLAQDYIQLVFEKQMHRWAKQSKRRQEQLIKMTRGLAMAGMVAGADTLLSNARYQQSVADKDHWQGALQATYSQLRKWAPALPAKIPALPTLSAQPVETRRAFHKASGNHPLIQVINPAVRLAEVQRDGVSKAALPNISILAAGQLRGLSSGQGAFFDAYGLPTRNYLAGIAVTWKLAPLYQKNTREKRFMLEKNKLQAEQESTRLKIQAQKSAAEKQIIQAEEQISAFEKALELSRQAFRLYQVRYESGLIDLATLLQVEKTLQETEKERLVAYYHYWVYLTSYAAAINDFTLLTKTFH